MSPPFASPVRFLGLDIHKHYLVATGVDTQGNQIYGPRRVELIHLDAWMDKDLAPDAVVLEMTTNTWQIHDELLLMSIPSPVVHRPTLPSLSARRS